jgi:predicted Zn-ribbon and HTH transcriptional regulator
MPADALIFIYLVTVLTALAVVAVYSTMRSRRFVPTPSHDRIFRCQKCGFVYTDDADVDRSRCSQCGKMNAAIEF